MRRRSPEQGELVGTAEPAGHFRAGVAEAVERATGSPFVVVRAAARLSLAAEALVLPWARVLPTIGRRLHLVSEGASPTTASVFKRGLLTYAATLMAVGTGIAVGILPGPSSLAVASGRSDGHLALGSSGRSSDDRPRRTPPPGPNVATLASPPPGTTGSGPAPASLASPSSPPPPPPTYVNPLARISNLQPKRIDQGVDYAGSGPLVALGSGTIRMTSEAGWPGGTFVALQLDHGSLAGQIVYYAENVTPAVSVGQHVNAGDVVGILHDSYPDLEIGWAGGGGAGGVLGDTLARADGEPGGNLEGVSSAVGVNFNQLLVSLGAPSGTQQGMVGHVPPALTAVVPSL